MLVLVVALMLAGCGSAQTAGRPATAYITIPQDALCEPPQSVQSSWSGCVNGVKTRTVYTCDADTRKWTESAETAACGGFNEVPVAYALVGLVLVVLAISSLILYKGKYHGAGTPAPAEPRW